MAECERVVSKTFPACVAFHKPSFVQQLKNASLEPSLVYGLLTCAARYVITLSPVSSLHPPLFCYPRLLAAPIFSSPPPRPDMY